MPSLYITKNNIKSMQRGGNDKDDACNISYVNLLTEKKDGLVCESCKLIYEIREDIPIMLIDEARPL